MTPLHGSTVAAILAALFYLAASIIWAASTGVPGHVVAGLVVLAAMTGGATLAELAD